MERLDGKQSLIFFRERFPGFSRGEISFSLCILMHTKFDVRYTAQLARLDLSEEEIRTFQAQILEVLSYVEKLEGVDVSGVEPTAHANAIFNVFREDRPRDWFTSEEALENAPRAANQLFMVPKVIE